MNEIHEECGLFGIALKKKKKIAYDAYYALYALQHRGQEGAGIAISNDGVISLHKDAGLVNEVFTPQVLRGMSEGERAVAHVRYSTTGADKRLNAQPLMINHLKGRMAIAHNGNLTNDRELREELERKGSIFHTTSDTEVIAYTITKHRLTSSSLEEAVSKTMDDIKGAFSLLLMSPSKLVAARDPWGFRPLCMGSYEGGYVFSSESCAFDAIGAEFIRDVEPGEIITVHEDGTITEDKSHTKKERKSLCVFEFIYFARPDSIIDGSSVQNARQRAGAFLALESPVQADIVIGVPDSGIEAALGYARQSGIPYGIGLIKNKYIGRTFISPGQASRENSVRIKLSPVRSAVDGKRVILVDDSIVRGTTSKRIVKLLRDAGAKEVHFMSSAPKFLYPCYFGTDIDSSENLFAYKHTDEEMRKILNVDSIHFLSVESVVKLTDNGDRGFCTACFSSIYPTPPPAEGKKDRYSRPIRKD
ncbi:MAG TPA: amidophosphoribosyltransferase [Candidatus Ornithospirochaeta stercorigallinarum]|nr:amidophosphoribosyltransferase [Candidatus Ornithospirochaeta stercorigallinarum]